MNYSESNPRKAFKQDVGKYLRECVSCGDELLLTGDFNECNNEHCNGMSRMPTEFQLVDLIRSRSHLKAPATYALGRRPLIVDWQQTK
jgi:hypothetical protein